MPLVSFERVSRLFNAYLAAILTSEGVAKFEEPLAGARLGMAPPCLQEPTEPRPRESGLTPDFRVPEGYHGEALARHFLAQN